MPYLKSCVMEAIRLHSVGVITRRVMTSFTVRVSIIVSVVSVVVPLLSMYSGLINIRELQFAWI